MFLSALIHFLLTFLPSLREGAGGEQPGSKRQQLHSLVVYIQSKHALQKQVGVLKTTVF